MIRFVILLSIKTRIGKSTVLQPLKQFEVHLKYVYCEYMRITFDPIKNKTNRLKHRIDLTDVEGVFYDDNAITIEDKDHDEERFVTLGIDGFGRLLVVVYHYRNEDIRVISARLAEPHERRAYEED